MQILALHLDQVWENKVDNKSKIRSLLEEQSKAIDFQLVICPELTLTGFSVKNLGISESDTNNQSLEFFKQISLDYKTAVLFGMSYSDKGLVYNRSYFVDAGSVLGVYDKNYLFTYAGEGELYSSGNKITKIEFDGHKIGLTTCFDLRFPELYREYTDCDLVLNIANWPATRNHHWSRLLEARAIENQNFVLGVNRIGEDPNGLEYSLSPSCFGPLGEEIQPKVLDKECLFYDIDLVGVESTRQKFPFITEIRRRSDA